MKKLNISIIYALFLSGYCGPAKWADNLASQVECGMSIVEVEKLTDKKLTTMEVPAGWKTHFFRSNNTDFSLGVKNGKVRYIQLSWNQKMMRTAYYQRIDLCTNTMME
ncbi:MAG: hypothetical protein Q3M30_13025 [Candidatus Electrothrix sp. Rat3]|nr:hypothetical protein [Candidatus Electrothrix rattekaaiensis]